MIETLLSLLPEIAAATGTFGFLQGILKFLNSKKLKKYSLLSNDVLKVVDKILEEHPDYNSSKVDDAIELALSITTDGVLNVKDFPKVKQYVIDLYDPRVSREKTVLENDKQVELKKKVDEKLKQNKLNN